MTSVQDGDAKDSSKRRDKWSKMEISGRIEKSDCIRKHLFLSVFVVLIVCPDLMVSLSRWMPILGN